MYGASISRWTMAYFAAAVAFLLAGTAFTACGFGLVSTSAGAPDTLMVVHLIVAGWLGLLFCGALLQFVPVLAATPLRLPWLAAPALLAIIAGLVTLSTGFLALGGHFDVDPRTMSVGAGLLGLGFVLVVASLATTILSKNVFGAPGLLVLIGMTPLILTVASGNWFAALLSGTLTADMGAARLTELVPLHAASGLIGWMTLTAIGVSYRLFAMFLLAPEDRVSTKPVVFAATSAAVTLLACLALTAFGIGGGNAAMYATLCLATLLLAVYVRDICRMFQARRRKALELNSLAGLASLAFLVLGMLMLGLSQFEGIDSSIGPAAFYLLGMGWLSGLGLAQLYKIVPFLTWLETYGPVMGRSAVPRVQDLVDETSARLWFAMFYVSVCLGACSILVGSDVAMRLAASGQFLSVLALANAYVRARRLANVPREIRLPPGAVRPRLIFATIKE